MIGFYPNTNPLLYTQKVNSVHCEEAAGKQKGVEDSEEVEKEFSQTIAVTTEAWPRSNIIESTRNSFLQSVQVVPGAGGKFDIYPGTHGPCAQAKPLMISKTCMQESLNLSRIYRHNISNPDLWRQRFNDSEWQLRKDSVLNKEQCRPSLQASQMRKTIQDGNCKCGQYHSHTFRENLCSSLTMNRESFTESISKKSTEVENGNANQLIIYNMFWSSQLAFCDYKHGRKPVSFQSLWPKDSKTITDLIKCGVEETGLRSALWELSVLSVLCGPLSVLKDLLELSYLRKCKFQYQILIFLSGRGCVYLDIILFLCPVLGLLIECLRFSCC